MNQAPATSSQIPQFAFSFAVSNPLMMNFSPSLMGSLFQQVFPLRMRAHTPALPVLT